MQKQEVNKNIFGDGVVTGHGTINGNDVMVYSQDFTVYGGSLEKSMQIKFVKMIWLLKMAYH